MAETMDGITPGNRRADRTFPHELGPGEYARASREVSESYTGPGGPDAWFVRTPNGLVGNLAKHQVSEHEDGTITASPSILVGQGDRTWHGWLERGVWREC